MGGGQRGRERNENGYEGDQFSFECVRVCRIHICGSRGCYADVLPNSRVFGGNWVLQIPS